MFNFKAEIMMKTVSHLIFLLSYFLPFSPIFKESNLYLSTIILCIFLAEVVSFWPLPQYYSARLYEMQKVPKKIAHKN